MDQDQATALFTMQNDSMITLSRYKLSENHSCMYSDEFDRSSRLFGIKRYNALYHKMVEIDDFRHMTRYITSNKFKVFDQNKYTQESMRPKKGTQSTQINQLR